MEEERQVIYKETKRKGKCEELEENRDTTRDGEKWGSGRMDMRNANDKK